MAIQGQTKRLLETILILTLNVPQKKSVGKDRGHFPRKTFGTFLFRHREPVVVSWNWTSLSVFSSMNLFSCILNECRPLTSEIFLIKESHSLFTCSEFVLDHRLLVSFGYLYFLYWRNQWTNIPYLLSPSFLPLCRGASAVSDALPGCMSTGKTKNLPESYMFSYLWNACIVSLESNHRQKKLCIKWCSHLYLRME